MVICKSSFAGEMLPVPHMAPQISQERSREQNKPNSPSLHSSSPASRSRNLTFLQQENEILRRITTLRKAGLWSLKRLPKLQEAPRLKSHHDYLLEEMQWMAADFAQERRWKMISAKRLIVSVYRYHEDLTLHKETCKKREEKRLKAIAAFTAREIECFWSSIKQVVDLKLQGELEERRRKIFNSQNTSKNGNWGPILVISQNFNVLKWVTELKCWCPALRILLYIGDRGELLKTRQVLRNIVSSTHVLSKVSITLKGSIRLSRT
eukprot:XP_027326093.1 E1A-binding protein p400-like [Anas platyrhynchos]